jgi:hypothetical protein
MKMSRTADRLYAMGFRLMDKGGFAKADIGGGVTLFIEKWNRGRWRCSASMAGMKSETITAFASATSSDPVSAAEECLLAALARLGRRKTALEDEARRLGNALEAVEAARTKNHKKEN